MKRARETRSADVAVIGECRQGSSLSPAAIRKRRCGKASPRESTPAAGRHEETHEPTDEANGLKLGAKVAVTPDDYGFDPVVGKVVARSTYEIAIEREEPSLGKIENHFPKVGFRISPA
jgi:glutathione S-transferase